MKNLILSIGLCLNTQKPKLKIKTENDVLENKSKETTNYLGKLHFKSAIKFKHQ